MRFAGADRVAIDNTQILDSVCATILDEREEIFFFSAGTTRQRIFRYCGAEPLLGCRIQRKLVATDTMLRLKGSGWKIQS